MAKTDPEPQSTASPTLSFSESSGIDAKQGLLACAGDAELYRRLLLIFRRSENDFVQRFRNTQKTGTSEALAGQAHALKGVAGHLGLGQLKTCAAQLEVACRSEAATSEIDRHLQALERHLSSILAELADF